MDSPLKEGRRNVRKALLWRNDGIMESRVLEIVPGDWMDVMVGQLATRKTPI